ncbi:hypothetical protein [Pantoea sp.]|uniref:hypothetical protein n=1 Tax=Pantoea sp. TaxID=69393 RepID=UPI0028ACF340|nr:hypothetical protein [Pantoea sp.]
MKRTLIATSLMLLPFFASAQWITNVDDDLFSGGKKATLVATIDDGLDQGLAFDCTKDSLTFAYIEKGTELGSAAIPIKMLAKVDSGEVINFQAKTIQRNSQYSAAETSDEEAIKMLLIQASKAKNKLLVGLTVPEIDFKQSYSIPVNGSSSAVAKFVKACEIKLN